MAWRNPLLCNRRVVLLERARFWHRRAALLRRVARQHRRLHAAYGSVADLAMARSYLEAAQRHRRLRDEALAELRAITPRRNPRG